MAYTDSLVGDFRRALVERHLLEDSLLDPDERSGEGLGDHGETFHGFLVYDTTIASRSSSGLPRASRAGRVVDRTVSHVDSCPRSSTWWA